ncbi:INTS6 [Mytilus coruscus]|uniref:INTS6 n=1 Tax=Mytilus coruscus TaxID=42192 RepID=A0A6J8CBU0_MYTCO|nr:INTS6 [Mytilus coruscus]
MTIILFLVDTSSSMNQRTYLGTSLIDIAKASVETFMKIRSRDMNSRWDRYMLLTFEDPPANIKAGWKESHATFITELKNLKAGGLTSMGPSLKHGFDLLNVNRMQSGIDTYGQGRCPYYLEPAVIITITDGGKLTTNGGVQYELNLPMNTVVPGSELTKEPFRWDQRIFGLVLKLPGNFPVEAPYVNQFIPSADNHPLDAMCEVTGGRSYAIYTQKMLHASLESLVQKVQTGVVINFEKIGPDPAPMTEGKMENENETKENQDINRPIVIVDDDVQKIVQQQNPQQPPLLNNTSWHNCRRLIYVPRSAQKGYSVGHWPIPEAFWPDLQCSALPSRTAQPVVKFNCTPCEPMVIENLPFDKYELEPSPLTQFILERRMPNICWQVYISNSAKYSDTGHPFGYLKASSALTCVNLFVMPYNYPVLLPLLDELFKVHKGKPSPKWRQQFDNYLKTMPCYYAGSLRRALTRMGAPNLVPDNMDNSLSYSVITYLKKLKNQAKMEMDRLIAGIGQKVQINEGIKVEPRTKTSVLQRKDFNQLLQNFGDNMQCLKQELTDTFVLVTDKESNHRFRNPYDIPRSTLLDQIARMRTNYLQKSSSTTKLVDEDQAHSIPVQQMGNYQDYLKKQPPPLRELENAPARLHTFGNPFKVKENFKMVDEADEANFGQQTPTRKRQHESPPSSPGPRKRKPGPLPRDFKLQRSPSLSSLDTPPSSPMSIASDTTSETSSHVTIGKFDTPPSSPMSIASDTTSETSSHVTIGKFDTPPTSPMSIASDTTSENSSHVTIGKFDTPPTSPMSIASETSSHVTIGKFDTPPTSPMSIASDTTPESSSHVTIGKFDTPHTSPMSIASDTTSETSSHVIIEDLYSDTEDEDRLLIVEESEKEEKNVKNVTVNNIDHSTNNLENGNIIEPVNHNNNDVTVSPRVKSMHNDKKESLMWMHNTQLRHDLYKEIKKPGRNYDNIFTQLSTVQGPSEVKCAFLKEIIHEAGRFKKKVLIRMLEQFENSLLQSDSKRRNGTFINNSYPPRTTSVGVSLKLLTRLNAGQYKYRSNIPAMADKLKIHVLMITGIKALVLAGEKMCVELGRHAKILEHTKFPFYSKEIYAKN